MRRGLIYSAGTMGLTVQVVATFMLALYSGVGSTATLHNRISRQAQILFSCGENVGSAYIENGTVPLVGAGLGNVSRNNCLAGVEQLWLRGWRGSVNCSEVRDDGIGRSYMVPAFLDQGASCQSNMSAYISFMTKFGTNPIVVPPHQLEFSCFTLPLHGASVLLEQCSELVTILNEALEPNAGITQRPSGAPASSSPTASPTTTCTALRGQTDVLGSSICGGVLRAGRCSNPDIFVQCEVTCSGCTSAPSISPTYSPTTHPTSSPVECSEARRQGNVWSDSDCSTVTIDQCQSLPSVKQNCFFRCSECGTLSPSSIPTTPVPTTAPTTDPTRFPSASPTKPPSVPPSALPSASPSIAPTDVPTFVPSRQPTLVPTIFPSFTPSRSPVSCTERAASDPLFIDLIGTQNCLIVLTSGQCHNEFENCMYTCSGCTKAPTSSPSDLPSVSPSTSPTRCQYPQPENAFSDEYCALLATPVNCERNIDSVADRCVFTCSGCATIAPTSLPTEHPSIKPSQTPSTSLPTFSPTNIPTLMPSRSPSKLPSTSPSHHPSTSPSHHPTRSPLSQHPTRSPIFSAPTFIPTPDPTHSPTVDCEVALQRPDVASRVECQTVVALGLCPLRPDLRRQCRFSCSGCSTLSPTESPTSSSPSNSPTISPSLSPTQAPFYSMPSVLPSFSPTTSPSVAPTMLPTNSIPTLTPTVDPSTTPPSTLPTSMPTYSPTYLPSNSPTNICDLGPLGRYATDPTFRDTLDTGSCAEAFERDEEPNFDAWCSPDRFGPFCRVTCAGCTNAPTLTPTKLPTSFPTTTDCESARRHLRDQSSPGICRVGRNLGYCDEDTQFRRSCQFSCAGTYPEYCQTYAPSKAPTDSPTFSPTTSQPSLSPLSGSPSITPSTSVPTLLPTRIPSVAPSTRPTEAPTLLPTHTPSVAPSTSPTAAPRSSSPSQVPSNGPSISAPTLLPTRIPSVAPSTTPTAAPRSRSPSQVPSSSIPTSSIPSTAPSRVPTDICSAFATDPHFRDALPRVECLAVALDMDNRVADAPPSSLGSCWSNRSATFLGQCNVTCNSCTHSPTMTPTQHPTSNPTIAPTPCDAARSLLQDIFPSAICRAAYFSGDCTGQIAGACQLSCTGCFNRTNSPTSAPTTTPTIGPSTLIPSAFPSQSPTTICDVDGRFLTDPHFKDSLSTSECYQVAYNSTKDPRAPAESLGNCWSIAGGPHFYGNCNVTCSGCTNMPTLGPSKPPTFTPTASPTTCSAAENSLVDVLGTNVCMIGKEFGQCEDSNFFSQCAWTCNGCPTLFPSTAPSTSHPSTFPSLQPTSSHPSESPSEAPTGRPSRVPSSGEPTKVPSEKPSLSPTTLAPTFSPASSIPTSLPTKSSSPTVSPTHSPSSSPTINHPTKSPTMFPSTSLPTMSPSLSPTVTPTYGPTPDPTRMPVSCAEGLSNDPSKRLINTVGYGLNSHGDVVTRVPPSGRAADLDDYCDANARAGWCLDTHPRVPVNFAQLCQWSCAHYDWMDGRIQPCGTYAPTLSPTSSMPTDIPTLSPTVAPTTSPTVTPTESSSPTVSPTASPSISPTLIPSSSPTTSPSTSLPTSPPSISSPTQGPSTTPTYSPTTSPTVEPSEAPSKLPSESPTASPLSSRPSESPSTDLPSTSPSVAPSLSTPTMTPTHSPTLSSPTEGPSLNPTGHPSQSPSLYPTIYPTAPSVSPSEVPSHLPTRNPTESPTMLPTASPTFLAGNYWIQYVLTQQVAPASDGATRAHIANQVLVYVRSLMTPSLRHRVRSEIGSVLVRLKFADGYPNSQIDAIATALATEGVAVASVDGNVLQERVALDAVTVTGQADPCSAFECAVTCVGLCGWDSTPREFQPQGRCRSGEYTTDSERSTLLGNCSRLVLSSRPQVLSTRSPTQEPDLCSQHTCVHTCDDEIGCGWVGLESGVCVFGETSSSMARSINAGNCTNFRSSTTSSDSINSVFQQENDSEAEWGSVEDVTIVCGGILALLLLVAVVVHCRRDRKEARTITNTQVSEVREAPRQSEHIQGAIHPNMNNMVPLTDRIHPHSGYNGLGAPLWNGNGAALQPDPINMNNSGSWGQQQGGHPQLHQYGARPTLAYDGGSTWLEPVHSNHPGRFLSNPVHVAELELADGSFAV